MDSKSQVSRLKFIVDIASSVSLGTFGGFMTILVTVIFLFITGLDGMSWGITISFTDNLITLEGNDFPCLFLAVFMFIAKISMLVAYFKITSIISELQPHAETSNRIINFRKLKLAGIFASLSEIILGILIPGVRNEDIANILFIFIILIEASSNVCFGLAWFNIAQIVETQNKRNYLYKLIFAFSIRSAVLLLWMLGFIILFYAPISTFFAIIDYIFWIGLLMSLFLQFLGFSDFSRKLSSNSYPFFLSLDI